LAQPIDFTNKNNQFRGPSVTRSLIGATCCFNWINCPYRGDTVTR